MKITLKPGDRGQGHYTLPGAFANQPFTVLHGRAMRKMNPGDKHKRDCYIVKFDNDKTGEWPIAVEAAMLMPPIRDDLDIITTWDMLPVAVVRAMKEGPSA